VAAVDLKGEKILLCEVTYAKRPLALHKRLRAWAVNWAEVRGGLKRDYRIPLEWEALPQVFVREECGAEILSRARADITAAGSAIPEPQIRSLREAARWRLDSLESLPAES
jgi:hypothetical protein